MCISLRPIVLAFSFKTSFHLWRMECCLLLRIFCHVIMNVLQMFCFLKYSVCLNHFLFYMGSLKPFINLFGYTGTLKCLNIKSLHKFVILHNFNFFHKKKKLHRESENCFLIAWSLSTRHWNACENKSSFISRITFPFFPYNSVISKVICERNILKIADTFVIMFMVSFRHSLHVLF